MAERLALRTEENVGTGEMDSASVGDTVGDTAEEASDQDAEVVVEGV